MKKSRSRSVIALAALLTLAILVGVTAVTAQPPAQERNPLPPAIIRFGIELTSPVTVNALENGQVPATFSWQTVGMTPDYRLLLYFLQFSEWVPVVTESLPENGAAQLFLSPTLDFAPPTYRLAILDSLSRSVSQQIIVVPFTEESLIPTIVAFSTTTTSLNPTSLGLGLATVNVEWQIENRLSISNLIFEQVLPDGTTRSVELPRLNRWVGSSGQGLVAPILPSPEAQNVVIRLRVIDMRDGEVFQEAEISVPIAAEASPAETEPITIPPLPTEEPTPGG